MVDGQIFVRYRQKWSGITLVSTTPDEQNRFRAAWKPSWIERQFSNVEGWSYQCCILDSERTMDARHVVTVNGEPMTIVVERDEEGEEVVVSLERRSAPVVRLYESHMTQRRVNEADYENLMNAH